MNGAASAYRAGSFPVRRSSTACIYESSPCAYPESRSEPGVIDRFLTQPDAERAVKTARKLAGHILSEWAIAGGWAVEIHCILKRREPFLRHVADIDFVVP